MGLIKSVSTTWDNDIFEESLESVARVSIKFKDDPVALSCAVKRIWQEGHGPRWYNLEDGGGDIHVTDSDRYQATDIKNYYSRRYTLKALTGKLTEFQAKLANFLVNEKTLTINEVGLLYRLPYFYQEDLAIDRLIGLADHSVPWSNTAVNLEDINATRLRFVERVFHSRRSGEIHQYWFLTPDNRLVVQSVDEKNPLIHMADSIFKQETVNVNAKVYARHFSGVNQTYCYGQLQQLTLK